MFDTQMGGEIGGGNVVVGVDQEKEGFVGLILEEDGFEEVMVVEGEEMGKVGCAGMLVIKINIRVKMNFMCREEREGRSKGIMGIFGDDGVGILLRGGKLNMRMRGKNSLGIFSKT
ncbi:hypothetical protein, partial [Neisseria sicca]|uniref:hypothetical protein n=1 Tax=Neisseria sicca TaxID=490 RepID=UPI0011BD19CC